MRYSPGSLVLVVCPDPELRDAFCERVLADQNALLSLGKIRALIKGRVPDEQLDAKAQELVDATATKRLAAGHSVVVALEGLGAEEREHYVRMAAPHRRPRHLVLVEVGKDRVPEDVRDDARRAAHAARRRRARAGGLRHVAAAGRERGARAQADRLRAAAARRLAARALGEERDERVEVGGRDPLRVVGRHHVAVVGRDLGGGRDDRRADVLLAAARRARG